MLALVSLFVAASILLLLITYFYSKALCFALILPLRACVNQMISTKLTSVFGIQLNPGDILGLITIVLCLLFIFTNYKPVIFSSTAGCLNVLIFFLLLWCLLSAALSQEKFFLFKKWAKMASWLLLVPVSTVVFNNLKNISMLRFWGIISLVITLSSVIIANIFGIGPIAYASKGMSGTGFHLGYYASESALSLALAMAIPLLFLPYVVHGKIEAKLSKFVFLLLLVDLSCILLIFLRASILAVLLSVMVFVSLSRRNELTGQSLFTKATVILAILGVIIGFSLTHQEIIKSRFSDVLTYEEDGKHSIEKLGSGRIWLLKTYFELWRSRGWAYKLFGIDTGTQGRQKLRVKIKSETHNDIMAMLYYAGIIGLFIYLCIMSGILRIILKRLIRAPDSISHHLGVVTLSAFVIYLVFVVHGGLYQILPMSYFAMVIGSATSYRPSKREAKLLPYNMCLTQYEN